MSSILEKAREAAKQAWDYTLDDLQELEQILRELAQLEGWSAEELQARLWERQHMAPGNVRKALHALRLAHRSALATWPERPAKRAVVTLCELVKAPKEFSVIEGGKDAA